MTTYTMTVTLAQADVMAQTNSNDISDVDRAAAIRAALEHYSRDKPCRYTADLTGDAGKYYELNDTNLTSWAEDFSQILRIEYPAQAITADGTPQYLDRDDWQDDYYTEVSDARVRWLFLPNHAPAATESMRITYTIPYVFSGETEGMTIPGQHFYAFCNLAASHICQAVAAKYSKIGDSTMNVDSASHTTKMQEFAARARALLVLYRDQLSLPAPGQTTGAEAASGVFVPWPTKPARGHHWLYHRGG